MRTTFAISVLCCTFICIAAEDRVVAVVGGRRILASEIAPPHGEADARRSALTVPDYEQWRAGRERERLRQKIWCELAEQYVRRRHIAPSARQIAAYEPNADAPPCTAAGALSTEIFDQSIDRKYGEMDARRKYLQDKANKVNVRIIDAAFMDILATKYSAARLSETQVSIRCANGTGFVISRRPGGRWSEEVRVRAGAERTYRSVDDAASERCTNVN
ncbi:MAG TPA: hypothetical protein VJZ76_05035 [Thermoanaerobaculia bacterium]|nr:hypothetical protein [Thermoanaerobaculia bacterium]